MEATERRGTSGSGYGEADTGGWTVTGLELPPEILSQLDPDIVLKILIGRDLVMTRSEYALDVDLWNYPAQIKLMNGSVNRNVTESSYDRQQGRVWQSHGKSWKVEYTSGMFPVWHCMMAYIRERLKAQR